MSAQNQGQIAPGEEAGQTGPDTPFAGWRPEDYSELYSLNQMLAIGYQDGQQ